MFYIESERLRLIPLNEELLLLYNEPEKLAEKLQIKSYQVKQEPIFEEGMKDALENFWLPKVKENPADYQWFTHWAIILKKEEIAVGGIGVSGPPNEKGETETGYGLDINQHGKGYATEALQCLAEWAFQHPNLKAIVAHTFPEGHSSQRVLIKNNFQNLGMTTTDDGEVLEWKLFRK